MRSSTLSLAFVALIALIAVCDARVEAKRECTPQTCAGPVIAYFDGTTCSGPAKEYSTLVNRYSGTDNGPCEVEDAQNGHTYIISATKLREASFVTTGGVNGSLCAPNNLAWYYDYTFGICVGDTKENGSFIYLRSVNDTFAPGPVASPSTAPLNPYSHNFECNSITNCTNTVDAAILPMYGYAYFGTSNGDTCNDWGSVTSFWMTGNFSFGTCYGSSSSDEVSIQECDGDWLYQKYFYGTCTGTPYYVYGERMGKCFKYTSNEAWLSYCRATSAPSTATPPSSSAVQAIAPGMMMMMLFFILALLL
jgi:hypothetical protein